MLGFFTSLNGRIGRKSFWLWTLGSSIVLVLALLAAMSAIMSFATDYRWISGWWFNLLLQPLLYPLFVIDVKRGHDRDFPTWAIGAYYVLLVVYGVVPKFGWPQLRPDQDWFSFENLCAEFLVLLVTIVGLYFLVELGFRKGTPGSNRFGPDPLARHFRTNTAAVRPRVVERNG
ncbi:MAG: DUF805 domain-containing protein [Xanthobacteraceae bacterium]